jgi:hypothetical protein
MPNFLQVAAVVALVGAAAAPCAAPAGSVAVGTAPGMFTSRHAVSSAELAQVRGGFTTDTGLAITLGIERLVTVNGNVVERSTLQLGDKATLSANLSSNQAQQASAAVNGMRLIQNGQQNIYAVPMLPNTLAGTVIQNSLSDQLIRNQTTISASLNSAALMQALNFHNSLNDALNRAVTAK